jgi:septal ring factor EnvC (AmiA/AmiB activator)
MRRDRINVHNALYHQEDYDDDTEELLAALVIGQEHISQRLARLERGSDSAIMRALEKIMIDTAALVAAAQRAQKDSTDILAVLKSTRDSNKDLAAKLQSALDQLKALPADTSAQEAVIAGVVADLNKVADDTEAAVNANPTVPDLPPAPPADSVGQ